MVTPFLGFAVPIESQAQKTVTIANALSDLDRATQGDTALTITGATTVTADEFTLGFSLELSGTPGAPFDLTVPSTKRFFRVENGSDAIATVKTAAGTTVDVAVGEFRLLYCDGANITEEGGGGGGGGSAAIEDEGSVVVAAATTIDFKGAGVTAVDDGGNQAGVTIPGVESLEGGSSVVVGTSALDFDTDHFDVTDGGGGTTDIALADQSLETKVQRITSVQTISGSPEQIQWNDEILDEFAGHDNSTDNERIVIGTNIVDAQATISLSSVDAGAVTTARIARYNSSDALQEVVAETEAEENQKINLTALNVRGGAAGDYLVVDLESTDAGIDVDIGSFFLVRKSSGGGGGAAAFSGARAKRITSTFAVPNGLVALSIDFNGEDFDTDNYHDNSTNPSRLTIPSGSADAFYDIEAGFETSAYAEGSTIQIWIAVNGEVYPGKASNYLATAAGSFSKSGGLSTILKLSANDYVELRMQHNRTSSDIDIDVNDASFISISRRGGGAGGATQMDELSDADMTTEAPVAGDYLSFDGSNWVPVPKTSYCRVFNNGVSIADNTNSLITFTVTDEVDKDNYHDPGSNPSRMIAPFTGEYEWILDVGFGVYNASTFLQCNLNLNRAGAVTFSTGDVQGSFLEDVVSADANGRYKVGGSGIINLTATDYLELVVFQLSGSARNTRNIRFTLRYLGT